MHTKISIVLLTGLFFSFDILPMGEQSSASHLKDGSSPQKPQFKPQGPRVDLVELLKQEEFKNALLGPGNNGKFTFQGRNFEYRESVSGTFDGNYRKKGYIFDNMNFDFTGEIKEYGRFKTYRTTFKGTSLLTGTLFRYKFSNESHGGLIVETVTIDNNGLETSSLNTKTKVGLGAGISLVGIGVAAYYFRDIWISKVPSLLAKIASLRSNK